MSDRTSENTDALDDRNPVDVLADEFASRLRSGESPSMQEYIEQYPEYAEQIQDLFPGVALLEQLSEKHESESSFAHPPRQDSLPPGYRFGDIEVVREVGRGGMGIVYEGYQHSLNRSVAVKAMSGSAVHSAKQALRFQREAQAAAQLHHTNIVPVFGVGEQEGTSYYVMQLINGLGLDAILTELVLKTHGRRSREERNEIHDTASEVTGSSLSPRGFADVLVSGKLSESSVRALGGATTISAPIQPDPEQDITVISPTVTAGEDRSVLEFRTEDRTEDRTGEVRSGDTPLGSVRSSLELRDNPFSARPVRSSLVLRDELPEVETFVAPLVESPEVVSEDPSLASLGPRYWRNIARIGLQVASGLHYAHAQGTLHRDIKPANILLDTDGIAWIADFGLAKLLQQEDVTKTGDVVGTLRYMAPEQFRGETDARSDLYSFGLMLYELLTLRPAYDDTDRQRLIARKLTPHDPIPPRKFHHGIPKDLETIVLKCLAWEPDNRYHSAGALVADLQAFLEDRPIKARPISAIERFGRWCRRNPLVASLSVAILGLLLFVLTGLYFGYRKEQNRAEQMTDLKEAAEKATENEEQATELIWQALDAITDFLVPERFTGPVEASAETEDESEVEIESTATVLSPQSAAMLEQLLPTFDKIAEIRGTDARDLERTANATRKLGDLNLQLGQHAAAAEAFNRAIDLYQQMEQRQGPTSETSLMLVRVHNGLSVAEDRLYQRNRARASLLQSLSVLSRDVLDPMDPTVRFERASTNYLLAGLPPNLPRSRMGRGGGFQGGRDGSPSREGGRNSGSERRVPAGNVQRGVPSDANDGSSRGPGSPRFSRGSFNNYDYRVSRQNMQTATDILVPLIAEFPSVPEYQFLLAMCHYELGSNRRLTDETDAREKHLAQAIEILEDLVAENPHEPDYRYQLSETFKRQYYLWKNTFRPLFWQERFDADPEERTDLTGIAGARADLERAVSLSAELIQQQPNVPRYTDSRLYLLFHLADVCAAQGKWKEAEEALAHADALRKQMQQRFPEVQEGHRRRGVRNEVLLGYVFVQSKQYEAARELLKPLAEAEPDNRSDPYYGGVFVILADALDGLGESDAAEAVRRKAERRREEREERIENRSSESSGAPPRGPSRNRSSS